MMRNIFTLLTVILLLASCSNKYLTKSKVEKTRTHKKVAILPVHVETKGKPPKHLTALQIEEIELAESHLFQDIIMEAIQRKTKGGRTPYWVDFISNIETRAKLEENGIDILNLYKERPTELAKLLEVDAVVRADVTKTRYMSNLASVIIGVGKTLNDRYGNIGVPIPGEANRTHTIQMQLEVVDGLSAESLYLRNLIMDIDYRSSVDKVVNGFSRSIGKYFPYKEHKIKKRSK